MSINLTKGQEANLTKTSFALSVIRVGLGWEKTSSPMDLDVSVFGLKTANGTPKLVNEDYFVFFNHLKTTDGGITHSGDNRTGEGDGDDETIIVDTTKLNADVNEISFVACIYEAAQRAQTFGLLKDAYIRIYNHASGKVICEYDLDATFTNETACQFGSLVKENNEWTFKAVGAGYKLELSDFVAGYK